MYWSRILLVLVACLVATTIARADVADDDFRVAARQFTRKRWGAAATELAAFLQQHPDHTRSADARYLYGETLVQLQHYAEARRHLKQFLEETENHPYTRPAEFRAAEAAFHTSDFESAQTELEAFRLKYPDDELQSYVLVYLGELALNARDGRTAVTRFEAALDLQPVSSFVAQCRFGLAQAHEQLGNVEDAVRLYNDQVESQGRYSDQAQFRIAMLRYGQADYTQAELQLESLIAGAEGELLYEAQYWRGMAQLSQQDWTVATKTLRNGLLSVPAHRLTHARRFALAEALRQAGRVDEAQQHLWTVFELEPPVEWSDDAGQILAKLALEANNLTAVHSIADQFLRRHSESPFVDDIRQMQGRAFLKEQKFSTAADIFERLTTTYVAFKPNLNHPAVECPTAAQPVGGPESGSGHSDIASNDAKHNDEARANRPQTNAAQATLPRHVVDRYYLAIAYLGMQRPADALRVLPRIEEVRGAQAIELVGGLRVAKASALLALGQDRQAIEPLEAYVSTHAEGVESVECHAKLIVALGETGQWYAAKESFDLFQERHGTAPELVTTATFLANLALARGVHDVAEPLFMFLVGEAATDDGLEPDRMVAARDDAADATSNPGSTAAATGQGVEAVRSAQTDVSPTQTSKAFSDERVLAGLSGLARLQFARNQYRQTVRTTAKLLAMSPPPDLTAEMLLLQGRALEADSRIRDALASYQQIYESNAMSEQGALALYAAARIMAKLGDRESACTTLAQLIQQHVAFADRAGAIYQLAWLRLEAGNMEHADQWFAQLVQEYPDNPLWADATFRLARNAARRQDAAAANRWLDELLFGVATSLNPDQRIPGDSQASTTKDATDIRQIVCHGLYLQGKLSVDAGQWLAALQSYQRIVEEYPQSELASAAWFWAAESNYHLGHLEQADLMLSQLAATAAETAAQATTGTQAAKDQGQEYWAMVPLRRAQIAAHRQQWHEALELAQTIQDQFPNFTLQFEADYLIGRCMSSQARFSMARQHFRQVISSNLARNTETAAMAQWMIGETYFHQSNYDDAIRAYYRVDALYDLPQWQAAALLQAAKCYELSGQAKEAQQLYSQLRSDYPQTTFATEATRRLRVATRTSGRDSSGRDSSGRDTSGRDTSGRDTGGQ